MKAVFDSTTFGGGVSFDGAEMNDTLSFYQNTFTDDVSFDDAKLPGFFNLSDLTISDTAHITFVRTILPDTFSFGYNSNIPEIDLTYCSGIRHADVCHIFLYHTDISKLKLDYIHFKLYFHNFRGDEIDDESKEVVYESLLKNFKDRGQNESFRLLDIEYQDFKLAHSSLSFLRWLPKYWWNYGYNKELVFKWAALFLLIFSIINFVFLGYFNRDVYPISYVSTPNLRKPLLRLWYAFVYSSSIFWGVSIKLENMKFDRVFSCIYILLFYTLGIICLAYMANFVLQK